jgi:alkanesulfonate monooxygenase SsuD/methylene tetrahydromethanopterin reductase-like flavin-dependent oxidoreductase (luciferase family)
LGAATAHLPWIKRAPPVFLAASHPKPLQAAGRTADGAFANFGLAAENIQASEAQIAAGAAAVGRSMDELEIWQIAALDCNDDRNAARGKVGAMLAFLAGYVIGDKNLATRGVPEALQAPLLELRQRYSTRPGEADIKLVEELGLFDYLSRRLSICGNPQDCLEQALAAKSAGAKRLMLTVSLASDPVRTVELFGEHVLPKL